MSQDLNIVNVVFSNISKQQKIEFNIEKVVTSKSLNFMSSFSEKDPEVTSFPPIDSLDFTSTDNIVLFQNFSVDEISDTYSISQPSYSTNEIFKNFIVESSNTPEPVHYLNNFDISFQAPDLESLLSKIELKRRENVITTPTIPISETVPEPKTSEQDKTHLSRIETIGTDSNENSISSVRKIQRKDSRESRKRQVITEADFIARREANDRQMIVSQNEDYIQIAVIEDDILVEHYVSHKKQESLIGNIYIGKVQNVLPSMEAAFIDIGHKRNAVLYAGEVNWDANSLVGVSASSKKKRRIQDILKTGDKVTVQISKDPVGQKGARLTSQISLAGRYTVYVPNGDMTGISRKLPDTERSRLKNILQESIVDNSGIIVRTAAEGVQQEELLNDISRLQSKWNDIFEKSKISLNEPTLLYREPDLAIKVVRDIFNEDFSKMIISGDEAWDSIESYISRIAPDLFHKLEKWSSEKDVFAEHRIHEQIYKALENKVFLPSGGSLVIDRTEAMTVVDVNTGKFTGHGGTLEETVTKNNLEAAEEIVKQLRLRDIGGIVVIDFIDMVLEQNRDLVLNCLKECLRYDRAKHQLAEVTSLGLVQMTRKKIGTGLLEAFSEGCVHCSGKGVTLKDRPVEHDDNPAAANGVRLSGETSFDRDRKKVRKNKFMRNKSIEVENISITPSVDKVVKNDSKGMNMVNSESLDIDTLVLPKGKESSLSENFFNRDLDFQKNVAQKLSFIEKSLDNLRNDVEN